MARSRVAPARPGAIVAVLTLGGLSTSLGGTAIVPALPDLQDSLGASPSGAAWALSGFLIASVAATAILGRLGDMHGKRRALLVALALFAAGAVVCALAPSLPVLLAGRVVQAAGGAVFPLAYGILHEDLPHERLPGALGIMSAILGIGGGAGPVIGGVIADLAGWRTIFWLVAAGALAGGVALLACVPESRVRTPARIDWAGAALLSVALCAPLLGVSQAGSWGWGSSRTLGLVAGGLALLPLWVAFERRVEHPLVDVRVMGNRLVLAANGSALLSGFSFFGTVVGITLLVQEPKLGVGFGVGASAAGLFFLPNGLAGVVTGPLAGRLGHRFGSKVTLVAGAALAAVAVAVLAPLHGERWYLYVASALMGAGSGFMLTALPHIVGEAVPRSQTSIATGVTMITMSVGASVGAQVVASIVSSRHIAGTQMLADSGFRVAFVVVALAGVACALLALALPRGGRPAGAPRRTRRSWPAAVPAEE